MPEPPQALPPPLTASHPCTQNNPNAETSQSIYYAPAPAQVATAQVALSTAVGATVATSAAVGVGTSVTASAAASAAASAGAGAVGAAGGTASTVGGAGASSTGLANLVQMVGFAQAFTMTGQIKASGLSEEYKTLTGSLSWVMLDVPLSFSPFQSTSTAANSTNTTAVRRRRLLDTVEKPLVPLTAHTHDVYVLGPGNTVQYNRFNDPGFLDLERVRERRRLMRPGDSASDPDLVLLKSGEQRRTLQQMTYQDLSKISFQSDLVNTFRTSSGGGVVADTSQVSNSASTAQLQQAQAEAQAAANNIQSQ